MSATILSVDDDPFYRDLYRTILEPAGYRFVSAMDPAEGWTAVQQEKPDLVLLDIMMPEKKPFFDGYGLLKEMRKHAEYKGIPIIMISALGDAPDVKHGVGEGATDYLPKQEMTPKKLLAFAAKLLAK